MGGDGLAVDGEGGGVEDLQAAVGNGGFDLGDLLGGALGAGGAERGDHIGLLGVAGGPVNGDLVGLALLGQAQSIGVVDGPVVLRGGEDGGGSDAQHVDVVADIVARGAGFRTGSGEIC